MSFSDQLKKEFTTFTLVLIAVAIVLNIAVGQLVSLLKLPIFLDSIGTILVGVLAGPWAGGLTGLLTNLIWGVISSPVAAAFAPVAMVIGITAGLCARYGLFKTWWLAILSGIIITVFNAVSAVPIRLYMFGGITGSGADFVTAYMLALGKDLFGSVVITVFTSNLLDKVVTALIVWGVVKALPGRTTARFPQAESVASR
ncbi:MULTISPECIES: ECF transporter S component [unclassified Pseudodesulfovibrio]|uniref:ECF transporter S component n=1 Tax=unclassified Pseudodesulfovibrio TaxID=2661612 RepID=UPI000FEBA4A0|nr:MULTISPECIES: ECF transporter S component [unclassified Pseudodesulfovibrio]MCJ2163332.1 ECF transporter S component [Pseudodesulfovibrio sp. S3-i]RWU06572.1 ECF transporter S component [Pseudodesulfovibrio sp. S3]